MSFFGLTSLGPESLIKATLVNAGCFNLYSDEDYRRGYNEVQKQKGNIVLNDIKEIITKTMGFAPLDKEVAYFIINSGKSNPNDSLSFEELISTLNIVRNKLNETSKLAKQYNSFEVMQYDMEKHKARKVSPNVFFKRPAHAGMNYGFYNFGDIELNTVHYPKCKCDETKYQEAMIKHELGK